MICSHDRDCREMAFGLLPVVTVKHPSEQETALDFIFLPSFLLLFFFFFLGTSSAKWVNVFVNNVRAGYLWKPVTSRPGDCLGGRRAQVPSQQQRRVTRSNTCDCTASYLNKRVGCLGDAHARLGACVNMTKTKSSRATTPIRTKRHVDAQMFDSLKCVFFFLRICFRE